ncbi:MAG: hypothetical protein ABIK28_02780, partial [Planctomycetota bacterium]
MILFPRLPHFVISLALMALLSWGSLSFGDDFKASHEDPYEEYVSTSKDFQSIFQNREVALKAWPGWIYMPWTWKWLPGYDEAAARWCVEHGYNGAFLDHADTEVKGEDKLAWIDGNGFRFFVDHLAGKGDLHLWDMDQVGPHRTRIRSTGVRPVELNHELKEKLEARIQERIQKVKPSPYRAAYALDDEISWGSFVAPCMWRCVSDTKAYAQWLKTCYGPEDAPEKPEWISYDAIQPRLKRWTVKDFDCSPLMDAWTFNDAAWNNMIHD